MLVSFGQALNTLITLKFKEKGGISATLLKNPKPSKNKSENLGFEIAYLLGILLGIRETE